MKIAYSLYELKAKSAIQHRQAHSVRVGALLKLTFSEEKVGYADCHPWEELGDLPLKEQLKLLAQHRVTPLTSRALHFAALDAQARSQQKSLFEGLKVPMSHYLIGQLQDINSFIQGLDEGHSHFKIKLGSQLVKESALLKEAFQLFPNQEYKIRLDFNLKIDKASFCQFLKEFKSYLPQIDFCEDPFNYHLAEWKEIERNYPVRLACDESLEKMLQEVSSSSFIAVYKPAIHSEELLKSWQGRIVVTSYLDHPLGQLAAAYSAATLLLNGEICGLHTHRLYVSTAYSEQLAPSGPHFRVPEGTGFGFDHLLSTTKWTPLTNELPNFRLAI